MTTFCTFVFDKTTRVKFRTCPGKENELYSFYLFTAAVETPSTPKILPRNNYYYPPVYRPYGSDFAEFIRTNKLGEVIESPKVVNKAFHSNHSNQVWVWTPNRDALKQWWDKEKAKDASRMAKPSKTFSVNLDDADLEVGPIDYN